MPLDATNFYVRGPVKSTDLHQFYDLFTGTMTDQPVTFRNVASIGGNQGITTVPVKVYGAPGQNTDLIDLYNDRSSAQPGFGLNARGSLAWGPGGTAPQDTALSRIGTQHGHGSDTPGLLINPGLEISGTLQADGLATFAGNVTVAGALTAGSLNVSGGGLGTIGATRINFGAGGAYIQANAGDGSFDELPKLIVIGATQLRGGVTVTGAASVSTTLTVTGAATLSGGASVTGNLSVSGQATVSPLISNTYVYAAQYVQAAGRGIFNGYDAGTSWGINVGGNAIASGYFYQRANGSARCWDALDFSFSPSVVGNALVQRDANGYITANYINYTGDVQGGKPAYVLGRSSGDNYLRYWPASAIGPPASVRVYDSGYMSFTNDTAWRELGRVTVPIAGYYVIVYRGHGSQFASGGNSDYQIVRVSDSATLDSGHGGNGWDAQIGLQWYGFLGAGDAVKLLAQLSNQGYSGQVDGHIYAYFVPVSDYPG